MRERHVEQEDMVPMTSEVDEPSIFYLYNAASSLIQGQEAMYAYYIIIEQRHYAFLMELILPPLSWNLSHLDVLLSRYPPPIPSSTTLTPLFFFMATQISFNRP